ncbi:HNH endonuclease [Streptomyces sp. NRRL WC-3618]|uniref:HNH endonuclease n=1 Tax=Streptomyces sp. NRRL WC-3618 TaxID=1519490 RepID=UPI003B63A0D6
MHCRARSASSTSKRCTETGGAGYIECHHVIPLHVAGEGTTKLSDLALICSNCHRMIHRKAPWPTPQDLRRQLKSRSPES